MECCGRCNRKLKDKKSIERGYGPTCWKKVQAALKNETESKED